MTFLSLKVINEALSHTGIVVGKRGLLHYQHTRRVMCIFQKVVVPQANQLMNTLHAWRPIVPFSARYLSTTSPTLRDRLLSLKPSFREVVYFCTGTVFAGGILGYTVKPYIEERYITPLQIKLGIKSGKLPQLPLAQVSVEGIVPRTTTKKLEDQIARERKNGVQIVEIIGSRSSEKQTLALEYASRYEQQLKNKEELLTFGYFDAFLPEEGRRYQHEKFAEELGISIKANTSLTALMELILKKLEKRPGFLLIFTNVNNEEVVSDFFKEGNKNLEGKIIITAEEEKGFEKETIVFRLEDNSNRLSLAEAIEIFDQNLGEKNPLFGQYEDLKTEIARQCHWLPLLIKQVAGLVKKTCSTKEELTEVYEKLVKDSKNSDPIEKIYKLCAEQLAKEQSGKALDLYKFMVFLYSGEIAISILQRWWEYKWKDKDPLNFTNAMLLLEDLGFLHYKDGVNIEIPNGIRDCVKDEMKTKGKDNFLTCLKEISDCYKTDNRFQDAIQANADLTLQIEILETQVKEFFLNKIPVEFFNLLVVCANNYIQRDQCDQAKAVLEKAQKLFEDIFSKYPSTNIPEKVKALGQEDPFLPAVYGRYLYYYGRTILIQENFEKVDEADKYFDQAIEVRKEITAPNTGYVDSQGLSDTIIFQRQGKGVALFSQNTEASLGEAEILYNNLITDKDESNKMYCNQQLCEVYHRLAQIEGDSIKKARFYKQATDAIHATFDLAKRIESKEGKFLRQGIFYYALGKLYLDNDNPEFNLKKAQDAFINAIQSNNHHQEDRCCIQAKCCFLLAKAYFEEGVQLGQNLTKAKEALENGKSKIFLSISKYKSLENKQKNLKIKKELKKAEDLCKKIESALLENCISMRFPGTKAM